VSEPSVWAVPSEQRDRMAGYLGALYGADRADEVLARLSERLERFARGRPVPPRSRRPLGERLSQADAVLISYADQIREPGTPPLCTLAEVLDQRLGDAVTSLHLLPFYPSSSDDGFSVIDYHAVDPAYGDWRDIERLAARYALMVDAVFNHCSAESAWFSHFLQDRAPYADYFVVADPAADLSAVTRPRAHPLLTPFETPSGTKHVWTTFSADQIDLNLRNPEVLLALIDALLGYVDRGARWVRLDAVGFLWKEVGTSCIHQPETHLVVKLFRAVLDAVAPEVLLLSETNVPHQDNVRYFGDGTDEAQLVYQFPLAPLVLDAFATGSARELSDWTRALEPCGPEHTWLNFIASHDGIGVVPAGPILGDRAVAELVRRTLERGGRVSQKRNPDGSQSPYELNITLFDALTNPGEPTALGIDRFMCSQAIMLSLAGVPGIYLSSLFGASGDRAAVAQTGRARSINRPKWLRRELEQMLADPQSRAAQVLRRYRGLLEARRKEPAFHPHAAQAVERAGDGLFALVRGTAERGRVLCAHNVTPRPQRLMLPGWARDRALVDLLTGAAEQGPIVDLEPYQVLWLRVA